MEEYQALALKLCLSEDDILEAAMIESQKEAKQLADHIDVLDDGLRQAGKERLAVPGRGDCHYLAFIEAAKEHGVDLAGLLSVRVKTHQMLANHPDYYGLWVDEADALIIGNSCRASWWSRPGGTTSLSRPWWMFLVSQEHIYLYFRGAYL